MSREPTVIKWSRHSEVGPLFEQFARSKRVKVEAHHGDDGIFTINDFEVHITANNQELTLSRVGAHHQNEVAERAIRTVVWKARVLKLQNPDVQSVQPPGSVPRPEAERPESWWTFQVRAAT